MLQIKGELVAVGFLADEARLAAVMKFLSEEEVFSPDDLEASAFVDYGPRICVIVCYIVQARR